MTRLLIVQPYIPSYRVPLFARMRTQLKALGIAMALAAPLASGATSVRGDDCTKEWADFVCAERRLRLGARQVNVRDLTLPMREFVPDLVIVEQAIKNLESWHLLQGSHRGRFSLGVWGQGKSYSESQSAFEASVKQWFTRRCSWFFSYTQAGSNYVSERGFPSARTTVLNNSTDTADLLRHTSRITVADRIRFHTQHGLTKGRVAIFLGGVDEKKGVPFLLKAAKRIAQDVPGFRLLIAGRGALSGEVQRQERQGAPIVALGRVEGFEKALALDASEVMMLPEWVGLAAVDALAVGLPVVTTHHPSHSPEVEYLVDGYNSVFTLHDPAHYARIVVQLMARPSQLRLMQAAATESGSALGIEPMSDRFVQGILAWRERVKFSV